MNRRLRAYMAISACAGLGLVPTVARAAETRSQAFAFNGHEQVFVVPAGVTSVRVTLIGGSGGNTGTSKGGLGAKVLGVLAVTSGEQLFTEVGGDGTDFEPGYNGGGQETGTSGGGGGASDVRTCSESACQQAASLGSRLLVAGGGGGGGVIGLAGSDDEGGGGGSAGEHGERGSPDFIAQGGIGGGAGLLEAGGAGGGNSYEYAATGGELGVGGTGGAGGFGHAGGGGGGGGIYGGGGGGGGLYATQGMNAYNAGGGGGGGGSSGVPVGAAGAMLLSSAPTAEAPSVTFAWTSPPPAVATGEAANVTSTSATLTGTVNPDLSVLESCHFAVAPAPPAGASVPCPQQIGSGGTPVAVTAAVAGLSAASTYTVTLIATSAQGSTSGSPVTFTTASVGPAAGSALSVTGLRLSPTRFRRGKRAATLATAKPASATAISFTLSQAATATLSFERATTGVLAGHRCTAPSKTRGKGRACTRYAEIPHGVTLSAHAGLDKIAFDGVLTGGHSLAAGTYRLSLTAIDSAGKSSAAQHPTFTIVD